MISWTTDTDAQAAYETAVRGLGAEPTSTREADGNVRVSADLPDHYQAAVRVLIRGAVAPEAITHALVEHVAVRLQENK